MYNIWTSMMSFYVILHPRECRAILKNEGNDQIDVLELSFWQQCRGCMEGEIKKEAVKTIGQVTV